MALLDDIKSRVRFLPEKDIKFATKFISDRNFEALRDIVLSDLRKLERKQLPNGGFEDPTDATTYMELSSMEGDVIKYLDALGVNMDDLSSDFYEDDDDLDLTEDEYFY